MAETIYTIPINEAFDACVEGEACECPFCRLYSGLEEDELELILGASMMEPDVRIKTNEQGFCRTHYDMMLERKNRLGMALMLQSHMGELRDALESGGIAALLRGHGTAIAERASKLEHSCYVCARIDGSFAKMLDNALYLWESDPDFKKKLTAQRMFCLPHFHSFTEYARKALNKKKFGDFYADISPVMKGYFSELCGDVDHFIRKFDYRFDDEPWGNAKDSVERSIKFLHGDIHRSPLKKK